MSLPNYLNELHNMGAYVLFLFVLSLIQTCAEKTASIRVGSVWILGKIGRWALMKRLCKSDHT
jgi:hypothetical protein